MEYEKKVKVFKLIFFKSVLMARKIEDATAEWNKQKTNPFNRDAVVALDRYDADITAQTNNTITNLKLIEFKHAISTPNAEIISCANRYLKNKANDAQNLLALKPLDVVSNKAFINAQVEYRDWRGKQISEQIDSSDYMKGVFDLDLGSESDLQTYKVTFFIKRGKDLENHYEVDNHAVEFTSDPAVAYTKYKDIQLEDLQASDIIDIIKQADSEIPSDHLDKSIVDSLINGVDKLWGVDAIQSRTTKAGYFTQIGNEFETAARYAFKTGVLDGFRTSDSDIIHSCKFDINKFMPTKAKIYQNPKVVQKMATDMLNSPFPAMHADLCIFYSENKNWEKNFSLNWTIHRVYPGFHTSTHLTYISDEAGLCNLPDTLPGIRNMYKEKIDTKYCKYYQSKIDSKLFTKPDDISMTSLHCNKVKLALDQIGHASYGHFGDRAPKSANDCGFIYEYSPDYTVIASTIFKPYNKYSFNCTSYTIIHWNTTHTIPARREQGQVSDRQDRLKTVENMMERLQLRVAGLDTGLKQIIPSEQFRLQVKDNHELDYFIPGILALKYAQSKPHEPSSKFGGYLIRSPDFKVKLVLEHQRHKLEFELLKNHILPLFGRDTDNVFASLKELVIGTFAERLNGGRTQYIPVYPGFLGTALQKIHQNPAMYNAISLIPFIKQWTLDWHDFLEKRMMPTDWVDLTSDKLTKLVSDIEDRNTVRRKLLKESLKGQHRGYPSTGYAGYTNTGRVVYPNTSHAGQSKHPVSQLPWTGRNPRTGNTQTGREHPPAKSVADSRANDIEDMGLEDLHKPSTRRPRDRTHDNIKPTDDLRAQLRMQGEIDSLKRTLNEFTLRTHVQ